jgi:hypothetical protein
VWTYIYIYIYIYNTLKNFKYPIITVFAKEYHFAGYGVRTHAHLCAEDLKSSPLTSRANQPVGNNYTNS